jgi:hypothetical protein
MTRKRLLPADRKIEILKAAVIVAARKNGWSSLTREAVAAEANCVPSLLSSYFGTMPAFRRTLMREAVRVGNLSIIAQGLAAGDPHAIKAPPKVCAAALNQLLKG